MSIPLRISLLLMAILAGLLIAWTAVRAGTGLQAASDTTLSAVSLATPSPLPDKPAGNAPFLTAPNNPTAICVVKKIHSGVCSINWEYLYADATPNYIISMTLEIDGKTRARFDGFFQTSMYVPFEMLGFPVACGTLGSGGFPNLGLSHNFLINAGDSNSSNTTSSGSVICPADEPHHVFLAVVRK
jgi:hypothetical protein